MCDGDSDSGGMPEMLREVWLNQSQIGSFDGDAQSNTGSTRSSRDDSPSTRQHVDDTPSDHMLGEDSSSMSLTGAPFFYDSFAGLHSSTDKDSLTEEQRCHVVERLLSDIKKDHKSRTSPDGSAAGCISTPTDGSVLRDLLIESPKRNVRKQSRPKRTLAKRKLSMEKPPQDNIEDKPSHNSHRPDDVEPSDRTFPFNYQPYSNICLNGSSQQPTEMHFFEPAEVDYNCFDESGSNQNVQFIPTSSVQRGVIGQNNNYVQSQFDQMPLGIQRQPLYSSADFPSMNEYSQGPPTNMAVMQNGRLFMERGTDNKIMLPPIRFGPPGISSEMTDYYTPAPTPEQGQYFMPTIRYSNQERPDIGLDDGGSTLIPQMFPVNGQEMSAGNIHCQQTFFPQRPRTVHHPYYQISQQQQHSIDFSYLVHQHQVPAGGHSYHDAQQQAADAFAVNQNQQRFIFSQHNSAAVLHQQIRPPPIRRRATSRTMVPVATALAERLDLADTAPIGPSVTRKRQRPPSNKVNPDDKAYSSYLAFLKRGSTQGAPTKKMSASLNGPLRSEPETLGEVIRSDMTAGVLVSRLDSVLLKNSDSTSGAAPPVSCMSLPSNLSNMKSPSQNMIPVVIPTSRCKPQAIICPQSPPICAKASIPVPTQPPVNEKKSPAMVIAKKQSDRAKKKPQTLSTANPSMFSESKRISTPQLLSFSVPHMRDWKLDKSYRAHLCDQTRVIVARVLEFNREWARRMGDSAVNTPWRNPDLLTASMVGFKPETVRLCVSEEGLASVKCTDKGTQRMQDVVARDEERSRLAVVFDAEDPEMKVDSRQNPAIFQTSINRPKRAPSHAPVTPAVGVVETGVGMILPAIDVQQEENNWKPPDAILDEREKTPVRNEKAPRKAASYRASSVHPVAGRSSSRPVRRASAKRKQVYTPLSGPPSPRANSRDRASVEADSSSMIPAAGPVTRRSARMMLKSHRGQDKDVVDPVLVYGPSEAMRGTRRVQVNGNKNISAKEMRVVRDILDSMLIAVCPPEPGQINEITPPNQSRKGGAKRRVRRKSSSIIRKPRKRTSKVPLIILSGDEDDNPIASPDVEAEASSSSEDESVPTTTRNMRRHRMPGGGAIKTVSKRKVNISSESE